MSTPNLKQCAGAGTERRKMDKLRARTGEEKDYRRKKLLASAKTLFSRHGFQGTKINMITTDAGLSPAAFYLYFKSKTDIYRELSLEGTRILKKMLHRALGKDYPDYGARITGLAIAYFDFFRTQRAYYDIITVHHLGQKEFFEDLKLVPELEAQGIALLNLLSSVIEQGMAAGQFRQLDPWKTAAGFWGMMDGILLMEVRGTTGYIDLDINTLTRAFIDHCLVLLKKQTDR